MRRVQMTRVSCVLLTSLLLVVGPRIADPAEDPQGEGEAQENAERDDEDGDHEDERVRIKWPSDAFPDLQAALDAAPDGAIVRIGPGVHEIRAPLFVRDKRLVIVGAGSGSARRQQRRLTHLVGPLPQPVVDERGRLILRADSVVGLWNLVGADVEIRRMRLSGFDAGIVTRPGGVRASGPTRVRNVVITGTGRGILSVSSSDLIVGRSDIVDTLWHGISFAGSLTHPAAKIVIEPDTSIVNPAGAGIYFEQALTSIDGVAIGAAATGGIVGLRSSSFIKNSVLGGNRKGGIMLQGGFSSIQNNLISNTQADLFGNFGDGITLASFSAQEPIQANVFDNLVTHSHRAGVSVFGGLASIADNTLICSAFDVDVESFVGLNGFADDQGGNECGCGGPLGSCNAVSASLIPAELVGGDE